MLGTIMVGLLGLCFGSFVTCLLWRRPKEFSVAGRSECARCQRQLNWYELIPVFSFLFLRGRCRTCKKKIPWFFPVVELATMIGWLLVWYYTPALATPIIVWKFLADLLLVTAGIYIIIFDIIKAEVDVTVTLAIAAVWLLAVIYFAPATALHLVVGAIAGMSFFAWQYVLSRGRWIGGGDIVIGILMGAVLGWPLLLIGLFIAYILGAVCSLILVATKRKKMADQTPLGMYLIIGLWVAHWCGTSLLTWYTSLL